MRPPNASWIGLSRIVPYPAMAITSTPWRRSTSTTRSVYASRSKSAPKLVRSTSSAATPAVRAISLALHARSTTTTATGKPASRIARRIVPPPDASTARRITATVAPAAAPGTSLPYQRPGTRTMPRPVSSPSKPDFWSREMAATFEDASVAAAYRCRPPHPAQTFEILTSLIRDTPRTVLDLGCGDGLIARPLTPLVDRVDAVDISAAMVAEGRRRPGGDHPNLRWIVGAAETAPLSPPYALITAG